MSVIEAPVLPEVPEVIPDEPKVLNETQLQLLTAERYMQKHGWCQHTGVDPRGRVCLLGAVTIGNYIRIDRNHPAYVALQKATGRSPAGWNDYECESMDEALAMLRRARELAA